MKSYQLTAFGAPLEAREIEAPQPTGTEVLLKVRAAGICHTDIHVWEGYYDLGGGKQLKMESRGLTLPHTMGHETVGEIVAAGPGAGGLDSSKTYLIYPWLGCGDCAACRRSDEHMCVRKPNYLGILRPGGYSTHILVPHPRYLIDIGDLAPKRAAPLACAGLTAFSAVKKVGAMLKEAPILIIGAGGLGLMALSLLQALGAKGAAIADIDPVKLEAGKRAGAVATIDSRAEDAHKQIVAALGEPPLAVIDFVGAPATVELGMKVLGKGGRCIVVGLLGGEVTLPIPSFPLRAIGIAGSFVGSLNELKELVGLVRSGQVPAIPIEERPLDQADALLSDLRHGKIIGRGVLVP
jgi:D-arabinose 1-dehydrogenase-like Zn-dependent alcohol dehydrogenase